MTAEMIEQVSVVIIVKNGAATLHETLSSLASFKEVILYDTGSTDKSLNIAGNFSNIVVHHGEFIGFGETKQLAVQCASNDWVLSLDADESATPELVGYLRRWDVTQPETVAGIMPRYNFLMGKRVKYGGWGGDRLVRLFNRKAHNFNDNAVHESIALGHSSKIVNIPHAIHR